MAAVHINMSSVQVRVVSVRVLFVGKLYKLLTYTARTKDITQL